MIYKGVELFFNLCQYWIKDYGLIMILFAVLYKILGKLVVRIIKYLWKPLKRINSGMELADKQYEDEDKQFSDMWTIIKPVWMYIVVSPVGIILSIWSYISLIYALLKVVKEYFCEFDTTIILPWIVNLQAPDPYYIIPMIAFIIRLVSNLLFKMYLKESKLESREIIFTGILSIVEFIFMASIPAGIALYFLIHEGINASIKIKIKNFNENMSFDKCDRVEISDET